jgi:hypothetical protein
VIWEKGNDVDPLKKKKKSVKSIGFFVTSVEGTYDDPQWSFDWLIIGPNSFPIIFFSNSINANKLWSLDDVRYPSVKFKVYNLSRTAIRAHHHYPLYISPKCSSK